MTAYLGLGSNLGNKVQNLNNAVSALALQAGEVVKISSFYYSKAWGFESENDFVNAAVCIETDLSPRDLLLATQQIEHALGRTQKSVNNAYSDRIIDIDILLYGDLQISEPDLKIPHPLIAERDFVRIPLMEISQKL